MTIVGSMRKLYENREGGNKFNSKFTLNFVYLHKIMNMEFLLFFFFFFDELSQPDSYFE